ncbi:uncharacterized protein LOC144509123 [Mustelus asterias]
MCQSATLGRGQFFQLEDQQVSGGPKRVLHRVDDPPAAVDICLGVRPRKQPVEHRVLRHRAARDEPRQIPLHLTPDLLCKGTFHKEVCDRLITPAAASRAACGEVEPSGVYKGSDGECPSHHQPSQVLVLVCEFCLSHWLTSGTSRCAVPPSKLQLGDPTQLK